MKRLILIKEGNSNTDLFADFSELINNDFAVPSNTFQSINELAQPTDINIGFFNKADNTFRLVYNTKSTDTNDCIAISHYGNNLFQPDLNPALFHPINFDALCNQADVYGELVYGAPLTDTVSDDNALAKSTIIVRDRTTKVIKDAVTGETIESDHPSFVPIVAFFGFVKVHNLPVYYLIMDSRLLKIGGGLDVSNESYNIRLISAHDGPIKNSIITPRFSDHVEVLPNNNIYVKGAAFNLSLFDGPTNLLQGFDVDVSRIMPEIRSNLEVAVYPGGLLSVCFPENVTVGYLRIKINAGLFLDAVASTESLEYSYSIYKIS